MEKLYQSNGLLSKTTCIVLLLFSLMLPGYPVFARMKNLMTSSNLKKSL